MSLSAKDFYKLVRPVKYDLQDLTRDECLQFGDHVYVLGQTLRTSSLQIGKLDYPGRDSPFPAKYLHLFCEQFIVDLPLPLQSSVGYAWSTIDIFAVQLSLQDLAFSSQSNQDAEIRLYYDIESGPASFFVNSAAKPIHVLRNQQVGLACDPSKCTGLQHVDLNTPGGSGVRMRLSGQTGVSDITPISAVPGMELRPIDSTELKVFGSDARRIRCLLRLVESLFTSAAETLMRSQPDMIRVMAQLRFIRLAAYNAPSMSSLVAEAGTLLSRLELPKNFPQWPGIRLNDWYFAPSQKPQTLASTMDATVANMLAASLQIESKEAVEKWRSSIRSSSENLMKVINIGLKSAIPEAQLTNASEEAINGIVTVVDKIADLRQYRTELDTAKKTFDKGIEAYKEAKRKDFIWRILFGIGEILFSVGVAIYTGGAGAPLTVGKVNEYLKDTTTQIKEASRLWTAIKALAESVVSVYPKMSAAIKDHERYSNVGGSKGAVQSDLNNAAGKITDKTLGGSTEKRIDYLGLLADWREMDIRTDTAFETIQVELGSDKINGMDEYKIALKKLAVRGETLVNALREAYEARSRYLLYIAESKARRAAIDEISVLQRNVKNDEDEKIAFFLIKQKLDAELVLRRRIVYNLLHEGVLALMYQSNNLKLQKESFASLSPALSAKELADQYAAFKATSNRYAQAQNYTIELEAVDVLPLGWQDLLVNDREVPFQIRPTIPRLADKHHMRINKIYADFEGLSLKDGSKKDIDKLEYSLWLGPSMLDRASPYTDAPSSQAVIVQWWMPQIQLQKQGQKNNLTDDGNSTFSKRALCCTGKISFRKSTLEAGWDLTKVTNIKLIIEYDTLTFAR